MKAKTKGVGGNKYAKPSTKSLGSPQPKNLPKQLVTAVPSYIPRSK